MTIVMFYHAVILLLIKINLEENTGHRLNSTLGSWLDILTSSQLSPSLPGEGKTRKSVATWGMQSQRSSDLLSWELGPQGAVATYRNVLTISFNSIPIFKMMDQIFTYYYVNILVFILHAPMQYVFVQNQ